ncbi:30S ribosomal protein S6 [Koleobacter methoxysyntrophicus]|uniref:Small ribosomal subunit protein bS6 n=1 Tax=Koleobacter methoxysyntrophicus TaxID=2751313 RepID=A0A8A0RMJ3_9FIRM|nr:30S ribosomal protein S6 [Koleobacter methoxysyntrophicus]QSQ08677.1 30S ribosomal protein S6 [Koleobacter methoxysyntrophicus]
MRNYETLFIIDPNLDEEAIKNLIEKFKGLIETNGGEITNLDEWGKRRLAYKVENLTEGYYVLINFKGEPAVAQDLERVFKITDGIVKYLIIRNEE